MMSRCASDLITSFSTKIILKPSLLPTKEPARHVHAFQLFDDMPSRDIRSFNSSLAASVRRGDISSAWSLFIDLHRCRTDLDAYTFTPVLTACSALMHPLRGQQVHGLMIKSGSNVGTVSKTALLDMYSKHGHLSDSIKVFEEVEFKDVVTWNAMISSFLKHGLAKDAVSIFGSMRQENIQVSEFTLCSVLKACTMLEAFPQGKQIHGLVTVMGRDLVVLGTALIDFYSQVGNANEAAKVYAWFGSSNDSMMHNSMIAGCVRNKNYGEAFSIMSSRRPNVIAMTSVLAACSDNSDLCVGKQIHCLAIRLGFTSDTQLCNALLDMYAKCGQIVKAKTLFDWTPHKDVISWTTMIDGYRVHGLGHEAFLLFNKMMESQGDVLLNSVTLLAVLSACGHSGLVDQGRACFDLARQKCGLHAEPKHYASFLDGLGRAGRMDDMWEVFHEMVEEKFGDSPKVWTALLNACGLNQDVARGEGAAKRLMELEPTNPANYVLVSNFYAAIGRWDSVSALRIDMRNKGLTKEAGSSWITSMLQPPYY